jgi:hypothetical protein
MPDAVDLYWLPLGAGGRFVRCNGRAYERAVAAIGRRQPRDLYHSALLVHLDGASYAIEMTPVRRGAHGAVAGGAVWSERLRRWRVFRYEVRAWRDGAIPDVAEAVDSSQRQTDDTEAARRLLELVPQVPTPVWRPETWNSNSLVAWLLSESGIGVERVHLPVGGRAPGWDAGLQVSRSPAIRRRASRMPSTPSVSR